MVQEKKHIIMILHGIRISADWAEVFKSILLSSHSISEVHVIRYGFFDLFRFLIPGFWRRTPATKVAKELIHLQLLNPDANISILAHSFGTYTISRVTKYL